MKDELLLKCYYEGWELSKKEEKFPSWFKTCEEKFSCLLGYNDCTIGINKEEEEILTEIKRKLYT